MSKRSSNFSLPRLYACIICGLLGGAGVHASFWLFSCLSFFEAGFLVYLGWSIIFFLEICILDWLKSDDFPD